MQTIPSIHVPSSAPRVSPYWLLAVVVLAAAAAALWPASPAVDASAIEPLPTVAALSAPSGDTSVPDASKVTFKDDTSGEPAPTF